jgi:NitT/TauT family transport system permease protein
MITPTSTDSPRSSPAASRRIRVPTNQIVLIVYLIIVFGIWELAVRYLDVPSYILPTPSAIVTALYANAAALVPHARATLIAILLGFMLGTVLGAISAMAISLSSIVRAAILPSLVALQSLPKITLAPLMVLWLGFGLDSKVAMAGIFCVFPVMINMLSGLDRLDKDLLELAKVHRAARWRVFMKLRLPHALPDLFVGMKIAMPLAVVGTIVAEFTGTRLGLGNVILVSASQMNTAVLFAAIVISTAIALAMFEVVRLLERMTTPWVAR